MLSSISTKANHFFIASSVGGTRTAAASLLGRHSSRPKIEEGTHREMASEIYQLASAITEEANVVIIADDLSSHDPDQFHLLLNAIDCLIRTKAKVYLFLRKYTEGRARFGEDSTIAKLKPLTESDIQQTIEDRKNLVVTYNSASVFDFYKFVDDHIYDKIASFMKSL
jgi:hypothetical protein